MKCRLCPNPLGGAYPEYRVANGLHSGLCLACHKKARKDKAAKRNCLDCGARITPFGETKRCRDCNAFHIATDTSGVAHASAQLVDRQERAGLIFAPPRERPFRTFEEQLALVASGRARVVQKIRIPANEPLHSMTGCAAAMVCGS